MMDVTDEELARRYAQIGADIKEQRELARNNNSYGNATNPNTSIVTDTNSFINASGNEHSLAHYENAEREWDRNVKGACRRIGRPVEASVVRRAEEYRERVENATMMEMSNDSSAKYGTRNWYMSLRASPKDPARRGYSIPVGSSYTGLWMQVTDHPALELELVRRTGFAGRTTVKSTKNSPFLRERIGKDARRMQELAGGIVGLQVVGNSALEVEMSGFKECGKPKVAAEAEDTAADAMGEEEI